MEIEQPAITDTGDFVINMGPQHPSTHGVLHLKAASKGLPEAVLAIVRRVPVGKGMAGLAVERAEPVGACNIQTDASGSVRPGAKLTGMEGAVVVPIFQGEKAVRRERPRLWARRDRIWAKRRPACGPHRGSESR